MSTLWTLCHGLHATDSTPQTLCHGLCPTDCCKGTYLQRQSSVQMQGYKPRLFIKQIIIERHMTLLLKDTWGNKHMYIHLFIHESFYSSNNIFSLHLLGIMSVTQRWASSASRRV